MTILRTEDWIKDTEGGMLSTCVVEVQEGEQVAVSEPVAKEFHIPQAIGVEGVHHNFDRFTWLFPYAVVAGKLTEAGYERVSSA